MFAAPLIALADTAPRPPTESNASHAPHAPYHVIPVSIQNATQHNITQKINQQTKQSQIAAIKYLQYINIKI